MDKMKVGLGPIEDLKLVSAVREVVGKDFKLMVDANHAYNVNDALYVGRGLDELDIFWFEFWLNLSQYPNFLLMPFLYLKR